MAEKISRITATDWERLEDSLMNIERSCFHPNIQETAETKREMLEMEDTIAFVAEVDRKTVGESYGFPLRNVINLPGAFVLSQRYLGKRVKALYHYSIGVLPEYQGMGIGKALKRATILEAKRQGYRFLVGHAKEGAALELNKKLGARVTESYDDWFNTGNTHYLYELDLENVPIKIELTATKQEKDYTCAPASLRSVLKYHGVNLEEEILEELCGTTTENGTSREGLSKAVESLGLSHYSKQNATIEDIIEKIDEGLPVMVNYFLPEINEGHYSVVVGYDKDNLYIMDVQNGREIKYPKAQFEKNWLSKRYGSRWMMAVSNEVPLS